MNNQVDSFKSDIQKILDSALEEANPERAVNRVLSRSDSTLSVAGKTYQLDQFDRIVLVGAGKATARMALATLRILDRDELKGVISVRELPDTHSFPIRIFNAGHPVPDDASQQAATEAIKLVRPLGEKDLVICLISGGASALWSAPMTGLKLEDKAKATDILLGCGADIHEINCVRKHLSAIKGGRLAQEVRPATLITLAISDVVGDDPSSIGSGPTAGDTSTFSDALQVVNKYSLKDKLPRSVTDHLQLGAKGELEETPDPGSEIFKDSLYQIIASNRQALEAASARAEELGYRVILEEKPQTGEAREVGRKLAERGKKLQSEMESSARPIMLISGGETTVTLTGDGKGGRNQELALAAALELQGSDNIVLVSFGTDGSDGPTEAAGAIVDGSTVRRGRERDLDAHSYLKNNDSYNFFEPTGDLICTGPTGTNVMDIQIVAVGKLFR